jgi:hypothetical protein
MVANGCGDGATDEREGSEESRRPEAVVKSCDQRGGRWRRGACISRLPEPIDGDREDGGGRQPQRIGPRVLWLAAVPVNGVQAGRVMVARTYGVR